MEHVLYVNLVKYPRLISNCVYRETKNIVAATKMKRTDKEKLTRVGNKKIMFGLKFSVEYLKADG